MPTLAKFDVLSETMAARWHINNLRRAFEQAPLEVEDLIFDFLIWSELNMRDHIENWEAMGHKEKIDWTLHNNSTVSLSKDELMDTHSRLLLARSIRMSRLHKDVQAFKSRIGTLTLRDLEPQNWTFLDGVSEPLRKIYSKIFQTKAIESDPDV